MTMDQLQQIDVAEPDPRAEAIHKKIWDGREFQAETFYRVPMTRREVEAAARWLEPQFGANQIRGAWWTVGNNVFMQSRVYTWWCLAHGQRDVR